MPETSTLIPLYLAIFHKIFAFLRIFLTPVSVVKITIKIYLAKRLTFLFSLSQKLYNFCDKVSRAIREQVAWEKVVELCGFNARVGKPLFLIRF